MVQITSLYSEIIHKGGHYKKDSNSSRNWTFCLSIDKLHWRRRDIEKLIHIYSIIFCNQFILIGVNFFPEKIFADEIPHCAECDGLVKPDIVFFGENLPDRFFTLAKEDFPNANLLIIMGSSLAVQPFASLVDRVSPTCPRLLLNREKAGHKDRFMSLLGMGGGGLDLDSDKNYRDVAFLGDCDDLCKQIVEKLGWTKDYEDLMSSYT